MVRKRYDMRSRGRFNRLLGELQLQPDDFQLHLTQVLQRHKVPGAAIGTADDYGVIWVVVNWIKLV